MKLLWDGYCYGTSGFANAGRDLLLALIKHRVEIQLLPADKSRRYRRYSREDYETLRALERKLKYKPKIAVSHRVPHQFELHSRYNLGVSYWETTRIPQSWVEPCNRMNHLILFSEMNRMAFRESGVTVPIDVIPSGVHMDSIEKEYTHWPGLKTKDLFIFLSVSAWVPRKGFDILIRAFLEEFSRDDDVLLIIKTDRPVRTEVIFQEIESIKAEVGKARKPPIMVHIGQIGREQLSYLYQMSDAYILPSRGEGVGLTYLEAGKAGIPVIATGWGGHTDFLNDRNSYLLNYSFVPSQPSEWSPWYSPDQMWAEPDKEHLKYLMRTIYQNPEEARGRAVILKQQILENHNWDEVAKRFKRIIRRRWE